MARLGGWCLAVALGVVACKSGPEAKPAPAPVATAPAKPAADAPPPSPEDLPPGDTEFGTGTTPRALVILGMTRPIGAQAALFSAKELNAFLSRQLGGEVTTKLYDDSAALGDALSSGTIEAAWLTPPAYVRASEHAAIHPIARLVRGGFTSYRSVIFVKADSKAKTLNDLKGKSMVWVAPGSASGRMFPRAYLKKAGKDPDKFFGKQSDGADHKEVCQAVLDGRAEAGATFSDERPEGEKPIVDGCREAGFDPAQFRVIERFAPIPNDVIAARADLPEAVEARIRDALLQMASSEDGKQQLKKIFRADAFSMVSDVDFAPVREVQMLLELK